MKQAGYVGSLRHEFIDKGLIKSPSSDNTLQIKYIQWLEQQITELRKSSITLKQRNAAYWIGRNHKTSIKKDSKHE